MIICKSCNSENEDDSRFCGICGAPLTFGEMNNEEQPAVENNEVSKKDEADEENDKNEAANASEIGGDSELNTTVLTADMNPTSAPLVGFTNVDEAGQPPMMETPGMPGQPPMMGDSGMLAQPPMMGDSGMPVQPPMMGDSGMLAQPPMMGDSGMLAQPPMMGTPGMPGQPPMMGTPGMPGQPPVMGQSGMLNNTTDTLNRTDILSKTVAMDKKKKKDSNKTSGGSKAYLLVSIIIMVLLAAGIGGSVYYFNGKVKDLEKKNEEITKQKDDMENSLNGEKADLQKKIDSLEKDAVTSKDTIAGLESTVADYETKMADMQSKNDSYAAFDQIIDFSKNATPYSYTDFFCSNNIVHMKAGETKKISTFFSYDSGNVVFQTNNAEVATCEWDKDWQGNVLGLNITAGKAGFATIKVSNDQNDEVVMILIYVE